MWPRGMRALEHLLKPVAAPFYPLDRSLSIFLPCRRPSMPRRVFPGHRRGNVFLKQMPAARLS